MDKLLISIIVPVYKTEQYLDRCVESIVSQTYKNLEIILVDDDSPDNCPQMCDAWAEKDNRIKVLHIENKGVANARNQGLDVATGDFIGFVDSDDYIEPDMFETLLNNLTDNNADISLCGYQINEEENAVANLRMVTPLDAMKLICMGDYKYGVLWNKLYKKDVIKHIKMPDFVCCEDLIFNYYVFKNAQSIVECDSKLYHYFQNEDSIVHSNFGINSFDAVKSKELMLSNEKNTELEKYAVRGLISSSFVFLSQVVQYNKCTEKYDYLRNYIKKYKSEILSSDLYSKSEKIKAVILILCPKLYNFMIKRKHS